MRVLLTSMIVLILPLRAASQIEKDAARIQLQIEKLKVLGSVLYIAAHPDDENSAVIAYLANHLKLRTGYLSLTRGDGGQNLIGSEQAELLGVIRTQELLAARRVDGGEQFFSRAYDFGYSKFADETFAVWNRDSILADVVWIIRTFRPDVILTRFPPTAEGGHAHHTASAILALEAFQAAGDPTRFPEQLSMVEPWRTRRIYWNAWLPALKKRGAKLDRLIRINTGEFNPLIGLSYAELSSISRSMHKSQGFGSTPSRAETWEYFEYLAGDSARTGLLDGIATDWSRLSRGQAISNLVDSVASGFDVHHPSVSVAGLIRLYRRLNSLAPSPLVDLKKNDVLALIKDCSALWVEAMAADYSVVPGGSVRVAATAINRSDTPITLRWLVWPDLERRSGSSTDTVYIERPLKRGMAVRVDSLLNVPDDALFSNPFWLNEKPGGRFVLTHPTLVGLAETPPTCTIEFGLDVDGFEFSLRTPVNYRWTDRVDGEKIRSFEIRPAVTAGFFERTFVFCDSKPVEVLVRLTAHAPKQKGTVQLDLPSGWLVTPFEIPFELATKEEEHTVTFRVVPPKQASRAMAHVILNVGSKRFGQKLETIDHPHIPIQTVLCKAEAACVRIDVKNKARRVGYLMGSGDDLPAHLLQLGCEVTLIEDDAIHAISPKQYDAIVIGIRAFNTRPRLLKEMSQLLAFVHDGGNLVVQYQVGWELDTNRIGPFPFKVSGSRVTDENAGVTLLDKHHPILNSPNRISEADFEGWIQERGLYFASDVDSAYKMIFAMHDPGEQDLNGSLILTRLGKGTYIYTGLAFFRQLPAGVSGAYRLFANLLSAGK